MKKNIVFVLYATALLIVSGMAVGSKSVYSLDWDTNKTVGECSFVSTKDSLGKTGGEQVVIKCAGSTSESLTVKNGGGGTLPNDCSQIDVWTPPFLTPVVYKYDDPYLGGLPQPPSVPGVNGFGNPFGHPHNGTTTMINYINPEYKYIVVSNMVVPNSDLDTKFTYTTSPGWGSNGASTMSISRCQGDFNPSTARCVMSVHSLANILLSNRTEVANSFWGNAPNFCHVEKGETYFINYVFAPTYDGVIRNNQLAGEECLSVVNGGCAMFWGEKGWDPGI